MKKILMVSAGLLLLFGIASSINVRAQYNGNGEPEKMQVTNSIDEENELEDEFDDDDMNEIGVMNGNNGNRMENTIRNTERLMERINNPDVGNQVQNMIEEQERFQERTNQALSNMQARPGFLKFFLGPDYKNAGEVRSEIVRLQNQVRQMTQLRDVLDDEEDAQALDEIINDLEEELAQREELLNNELSGFSLFGWLSKLLAGY